MAQHRPSPGYNEPLSWRDTLTGHGFALLALAALLLDGSFRRLLWAERVSFAPQVAMTLLSLLLLQHSRLSFIQPMMPKHFARGYPFVGLWTLLFCWLQHVQTRLGTRARALPLLGALCVA